MISISNLSIAFEDKVILNNISLQIKEGEFVFLQGASGSGKTTLLKALTREIDHFQGEILLNQKPSIKIPKYKVRRMIGTIYQSFQLLQFKTSLQNVALAGEILGKDEKEINKEALLLINKLGLSGKEQLYPNQLSGGEQQRLAIARALLNRPSIILADEPTGNLDNKNSMEIIKLLKKINEDHGITMIIVTHSNELVNAFPTRTLKIENGGIFEL